MGKVERESRCLLCKVLLSCVKQCCESTMSGVASGHRNEWQNLPSPVLPATPSKNACNVLFQSQLTP